MITQFYPAFTQFFLSKTRVNEGIPSFTQNYAESVLYRKKEKPRLIKNLFFLYSRCPVVQNWVILGKSTINIIKTMLYPKSNLGIFWVFSG
jgi:hypothetical protein